jgi:hypothetical protein
MVREEKIQFPLDVGCIIVGINTRIMIWKKGVNKEKKTDQEQGLYISCNVHILSILIFKTVGVRTFRHEETSYGR